MNKANNNNLVKVPVNLGDFLSRYHYYFMRYIKWYKARWGIDKEINYDSAHKYATRNLLPSYLAQDVEINLLCYPLMSAEASGRFQNVIFSKSKKGKNYTKQYTKPRDPKTEKQLKIRAEFKQASQAYRYEPEWVKELWRKAAENTNNIGHSLYISQYLKIIRAGGKVEHPFLPK